MKRLAIIFSILTVFCNVNLAQRTYPMGLDMDDAAYEDIPYASENIQIENGQRFSAAKVDLSPYCPEVRHQGEIASCVGWAVGYSAMTIERAIKNNWKDRRKISENANSALFIYNQLRQGECDRGVNIPKTLEMAQKNGNCLAREYDFDINNCSSPISDALMERAAKYRIADYIRLFEVNSDAAEKINRVKAVLAQKKPVIVGVTVLQNFYEIEEGESIWWPKFGNTTYAGGHAMVVVGYDDNKFPNIKNSADEKGAFKLMNSWGKNWGENGFIWIRYSDFAQYCRYACTMMLETGDPIQLDLDQAIADAESTEEQEVVSRELNQLSGTFGFRHYLGWGDGPIFQESPVNLIDDNFYELAGEWSVGDQFQLYTKSGFDNGYIYVFSIDANGKSEVHFPRAEAYNPRFQGLNETALVMSRGSTLTIPSEDSVLKLSQIGSEHLVVLFSTQKIVPKYIEYLCHELADKKDNLKEHLENLLDKYTFAASDITFIPGKMGFDVSTRNDGKIIPVVLRVEVTK